MKKGLIGLMLCALLALPLAACDPAPDGGKGNSETATPVKVTVTENGVSDSRGYATLNEALPKIKKKIADGSSKVSVKVELSEGTHVLSAPAVFSYAALAGKDYELDIVGAGADKTTVTSAVTLDNAEFIDFGDDVYAYTLPETYCTDGEYPVLRDLMMDGELLEVARTELANFAEGVNKTERDKIFYVDASFLEAIPEDEVEGTELWIKNVWCYMGARIQSYNAQDPKYIGGVKHYPVTLNEDDAELLSTVAGCSGNANFLNDPYWCANKLEYLTEPDTFVYDRAEGTFYVKTDGIEGKTFSVPMLPQLFEFEDVKNVTVEGIKLTGTTSTLMTEQGYVRQQAGGQKDTSSNWLSTLDAEGVIHGNNVSNFTVKNCEISELGYDGIVLQGKVENVSLAGNSIHDIDSAAIRIGTPAAYSPDNHNSDITIENNLIENIAKEYLSSPAVHVFYANRLSILHNTLRHTSYSAISLGWGWGYLGDFAFNLRDTEVAYNFIDDYMTDILDGGAIYCTGCSAADTNTEYFNHMHDNFVVINEHTGIMEGSAHRGYYMCLYLDGPSSNWEVYNNVVCTADAVNPVDRSYIYYQHIAGTQSHNNHSEHNYIVNLTEEERMFEESLNPLYNNTESENYMLENYAALKEQYPDALGIVAAAGCDAQKGVWPDEN